MTSSLDWETVRNDDLTIRQKEVIKSEEQQRLLLQSAIEQDFSEFISFFRRIGIEGNRRHKPIPQMTESEFVDPTWTTECQIWENYKDLPPVMAATPGCWTRICLQAVEEERISPASFARPPNSTKDANGLSRITAALNDEDQKEIASCTTRIFRVMGGLLGPRGYRTTYIDCPIARSWWRHRVAMNAAFALGKTENTQSYSQVLRATGVWEPLMEHIVSRQAVIGFPTVVSALVCRASQIAEDSGSVGKSRFLRVLVQAGGRCANQALDLLGIDQVIGLISEQSL